MAKAVSDNITNPKPLDETDRVFSDAFRDLEGDICDLTYMSSVVGLVADEAVLRPVNEFEKMYQQRLGISTDVGQLLLVPMAELDALNYSLRHLSNLIDALRARYYETYERSKAAANA